MEFDAFVSYRREVWALAGRISDYLKSRGISTFLDKDKLPRSAGDGKWKIKIDDALKDSRWMILLVSKNSFPDCKGERVKNDPYFHEIEGFLKKHPNGENIITLLVDGAEIPKKLPKKISAILGLERFLINASNVSQYYDAMDHIIDKVSRIVPYNPQDNWDINGTYFSVYADLENDGHDIAFRKTSATLNMKDGRVSGVTSFDKKKTWELQGEILPNNCKCIVGKYFSKCDKDEGVGTFFLQKRGNGVLAGTWSGFDSVTQKPFSGAYIFRKQKFRIVEADEKADMYSIKEISNKQLGENYLTKKSLDYFDDQADGRVLLVAKERNEILGFSFAGILGREKLVEDVLQGKESNVFETCSKIGYLKTIATDPEHEDCGVATMLVEQTVERLKTLGAEMLISTVWAPAGHHTASSLLKSHGFRLNKAIERYWERASKAVGFSCPVCGNNGCVCACEIWYCPVS